MKKFASVLLIGSILSVPAAAQVRPGDCRPVLPVLDKAVAVVPQDVLVPQATPVVPAASLLGSAIPHSADCRRWGVRDRVRPPQQWNANAYAYSAGQSGLTP